MSRRSILRVLLSVFGVALLGVVACIFPWLTTLGFIRTEHSSEIGYEGASFWHSGLPFRFLTRSNLSVGGTIDSSPYWSDVFFWFVVFLLLFASIRYCIQRPRSSAAA